MDNMDDLPLLGGDAMIYARVLVQLRVHIDDFHTKELRRVLMKPVPNYCMIIETGLLTYWLNILLYT